MLFCSPIVFLLSSYGAFMFGLTYLLFTTFPAVFEDTYGWKADISGLAYLGLGIGMIISIGLFAVLSDKLLHQPHGGTLARPELCLILMIWTSPLVPIGFFWYGWSARYHRLSRCFSGNKALRPRFKSVTHGGRERCSGTGISLPEPVNSGESCLNGRPIQYLTRI